MYVTTTVTKKFTRSYIAGTGVLSSSGVHLLFTFKSVRPALALAAQSNFHPNTLKTIRKLSVSRSMDKRLAQEKQSLPSQEHWKLRAPYRIHEPNEHFKAKYEASCHCGKVKYQLSRDAPLDSKLCHCTTCQTQHGKPLANDQKNHLHLHQYPTSTHANIALGSS